MYLGKTGWQLATWLLEHRLLIPMIPTRSSIESPRLLKSDSNSFPPRRIMTNERADFLA